MFLNPKWCASVKLKQIIMFNSLTQPKGLKTSVKSEWMEEKNVTLLHREWCTSDPQWNTPVTMMSPTGFTAVSLKRHVPSAGAWCQQVKCGFHTRKKSDCVDRFWGFWKIHSADRPCGVGALLCLGNWVQINKKAKWQEKHSVSLENNKLWILQWFF